MQKGIVGKKLGMTQLFDANGNVVPVTVIEAGPCVVVQKKTIENDGYEAVQVGFGDQKVARVNKPMKGHFDKNGVAPKKVLREFRLSDISSVNVGDVIRVKVMEIDDKGRINLSRRAVLIEVDGLEPENDIAESPAKPRRSFDKKGRKDRR